MPRRPWLVVLPQDHTRPPARTHRQTGENRGGGAWRQDVYVKLARCCTPCPGTPTINFVTRGSKCQHVHRSATRTIEQLITSPNAWSTSLLGLPRAVAPPPECNWRNEDPGPGTYWPATDIDTYKRTTTSTS